VHTTLPLDGITVLALEHAIAVPLCTRQLAELGARVIKVERRETGDFARAYDDRVKGLCSHFVWTNRSKQSLTLDLKHPQSTEILTKLVARSDVVIQNLAPGVTDRLGLSYEKLHSQFDQLIVCDITGYGKGGPFEGKKAYDLLVQCEAGLLSITGTENEIAKSAISIADIAAGSQAYSSILAALIQRGKTGEGSHIEISLLESMVEWMGFPLYYAFDGASAPSRSGADHASIYPYGAFSTADSKTIMLGIQNEREWLAFCEKVLLAAELATDPRFSSNSVRSAQRHALKEIINEIFSHLELAQICQRLDAAQIAYAQVNDIEDVWNHPQLKALQRLVEIETPAGNVPAFKPPGNNSSFDHRMDAVPSLGQHTREVLNDLGYSQDQIQQFEADKVV
jgi:itaconate CoA-transferase